MPAAFLLTSIFLLELASAALDAIGYGALASYLWSTYTQLTNNQKANQRLTLRKSITDLRSQLSTISSVDEFAKWAKLRRKLDAASSSFERVSGDLALEKTAFELYINLLMRVFIYGSRTVLSVYNYRTAVFYVPANWFYPVLWFLSLPGAPMGSVSVAVWAFACNRVCKRGVATLARVFAPVAETNMPARRNEENGQDGAGGVRQQVAY
ncbi:CHD5-like protein-domain-containing protein [Kickxella alabastrina]|uniref:CHD5-like protein-domain-containing protein n=1 Tax=Kickxella alabastrina TaxID=61397 RepID=UPI00221FBD98|nr:CHD5-like protein-domain-containing protein [Kickxella alabastrina]KAI7828479.1 CHD5-like protein-domain-containing protein [Kickxella alabastrina]